jgi:hypothetical protein
MTTQPAPAAQIFTGTALLGPEYTTIYINDSSHGKPCVKAAVSPHRQGNGYKDEIELFSGSAEKCVTYITLLDAHLTAQRLTDNAATKTAVAVLSEFLVTCAREKTAAAAALEAAQEALREKREEKEEKKRKAADELDEPHRRAYRARLIEKEERELSERRMYDAHRHQQWLKYVEEQKVLDQACCAKRRLALLANRPPECFGELRPSQYSRLEEDNQAAVLPSQHFHGQLLNDAIPEGVSVAEWTEKTPLRAPSKTK